MQFLARFKLGAHGMTGIGSVTMDDHSLSSSARPRVGHKRDSKCAAATALGTTEGAARVAVHRMRKQFRQLFRLTIAETVDAAGDVDAEMRHLVAVLSRA